MNAEAIKWLSRAITDLAQDNPYSAERMIGFAMDEIRKENN